MIGYDLKNLICIFNVLQGKGTGSGHRTLLYGNAILLRHQNSDMVCIESYISSAVRIIMCRIRTSWAQSFLFFS